MGDTHPVPANTASAALNQIPMIERNDPVRKKIFRGSGVEIP